MDIFLIWPILARLTILLLTALLAWVTYRSHMLLKEFQPDFNLLLSPAETGVRLGLVGFCLFLAWLSGLPAAQFGLTPARPLWAVGVGLAAGVTIQVAVNLVTTWAIHRFGRHIYSPLVVRNVLPARPLEWLLVPLALAPAVAMEELLFRMLWLGAFEGVLPWSILILGTSIIFGFMHQPQGKLGMLVAGGINILFSMLFIWSGNLLAPLVAHYTVNLLQLVVAHFQRDWLENY